MATIGHDPDETTHLRARLAVQERAIAEGRAATAALRAEMRRLARRA